MKTTTGRYSGYIRPFLFLIDFLIINYLLVHIMTLPSLGILFSILISSFWFIIASNLGFYEVYRYTKVIAILNCSLKQGLLFTLLCIVLEFIFFDDYNYKKVVVFTSVTILLILFVKLFVYYFLKKYRVLYGGNYRTVVLLGNTKSVKPLKNFFIENPDYGYQLINEFDLHLNKKAQIEECLSFVLEHKIDELYCSMSELSNSQIDDIIFFADNNLKTLKFIPDEKQLLLRNYKFEYYDYIPVISLRDIVLDKTVNKIIKRAFDVLFSLVIIFGILSWLTPILAILIKRETKGPLFFVQNRNGLNYHEFKCYKFRSMELNDQADINQVSKNDSRITKTGKFMRKTSMDELPQFFNVLLGDMSVVGPRPHMVSHTNMYAQKIDKFMVRHFIKPGITGLAQTKGYRGEVEKELDIINRVKYDIFYIENWSILLDIKIIFTTIFNTLRGDKKAY